MDCIKLHDCLKFNWTELSNRSQFYKNNKWYLPSDKGKGLSPLISRIE